KILAKHVAIEQRHADNQLERLPGLAAELVRLQVSVIVGNVVAVDAARAATATIPIGFVTGEDPVPDQPAKIAHRIGTRFSSPSYDTDFHGTPRGLPKIGAFALLDSGREHDCDALRQAWIGLCGAPEEVRGGRLHGALGQKPTP